MIKTTAAPMVPIRKAFSGDCAENTFTMAIPITEQIRPAEASARGRNIRLFMAGVGPAVVLALLFGASVLAEAVARLRECYPELASLK